jgi:hypothetical protein
MLRQARVKAKWRVASLPPATQVHRARRVAMLRQARGKAEWRVASLPPATQAHRA